MRIDPERVETDGVCTSGVKLDGWRILDASLKSCQTLRKLWSEHSTSDSGTRPVTTVLKCLKEQLQDDGLLGINAFEAGDDGARLTNVGRFS